MSEQITAPVAEISRLSGLGMTTIYKLLGTGELQSITAGRRRLIIIESWRRYVADHLNTPAAAPAASPPRRRKGGARSS